MQRKRVVMNALRILIMIIARKTGNQNLVTYEKTSLISIYILLPPTSNELINPTINFPMDVKLEYRGSHNLGYEIPNLKMKRKLIIEQPCQLNIHETNLIKIAFRLYC